MIKELAIKVLIALAERFLTAENIKKLSKELTTKLFDWAIDTLEKDGITPLEAIVIEVIKEIRA